MRRPGRRGGAVAEPAGRGPEPTGSADRPQDLPRRRPAAGTSTIPVHGAAFPPVLAWDEPAGRGAARPRHRRPRHRHDRTAANRTAAGQPAPAEGAAADRTAAGQRPAAEQAGTAAASDPAGRAAAEAAERAGVGRRVGDPSGGQPAGSPTLPRRRPGEAAAQRRNGAAGVDDATVEMARPVRPDARQHPAADARAYTRLYDETDRVAAAVAEGRMEFRHAVAKIALAAPGRLDLLDRVIETERRLAGVQMGASAPSEVTLKLLTTARRVVSGEVALVGPTGERVEQASSMLRLIHPDRTTREYRSATELARHLDLDTLSFDAPGS